MSKISFDIVKREISIIVAPVLENGEYVIDLDIQKELYSQGKIDWVASSNLRRLRFPISAVGGNPLPGSKVLGDTYFIESDWKINPYEGSHRFRVNGNFYSRDGTSPFNKTVGSYNIFLEQTVSSLVDSTIQQLAEIEVATFNGGVTVDEVDGTEDLLTGLPGSPSNPVKLLTDAVAIRNQRKLPKKIFVIGDLDIGNTVSLSGYEFIGESSLKTLITIDDIADIFNCEFYNCQVNGTLDGFSQIERSIVNDLFYVEGFIYKCAIGPSSITLGQTTTANLFSCYSTQPGVDTPEINGNGSGILALRDYHGGVKLTNFTEVLNSHSIDLSSGQCILDSVTVTAGTFVVRGIGKLVDENGKEIETTVIYDENGVVIGNNPWNGNVTIINELVTSKSQKDILDFLRADERKDKLNNKYYKLRAGTTEILLEKNYSDDINEEKLVKP